MKDPLGSGSGAPLSHGFRANLTASLADLVQMECLARSTQVIRVISGGDVGYLYFQAGQIVHAMSSSSVGEAAALEILRWEQGSFEPCSAGWTSAPTISRSWQALLMQAAAESDEARRDSQRNNTVVNFPREKAVGSTMPEKSPPTLSNHPRTTVTSSQSPPSVQPSSTPTGRGIDRAVRLDAEGKVVSARGDAEELASVTAYATRLAALVGERLGMEELRAVECLTATTRRLFYVEKSGNLIGLEAAINVDLGPLREKLGL